MTNKEARELLKRLEDMGTIENNLSMDQIYALRVAQGALDDIAEYKRLLKLAVEDFAKMDYHIYDCDKLCDDCPLSGERDHCLKWRYYDKALALIGEDGDKNER